MWTGFSILNPPAPPPAAGGFRMENYMIEEIFLVRVLASPRPPHLYIGGPAMLAFLAFLALLPSTQTSLATASALPVPRG